MIKHVLTFLILISFSSLLKGQTQTQDLNMGLYQLQFPSANGGSNRIQSFGGTFPGTWLFKSRFDNITLDAGENENNKYKILFLSGGIERARMNGDGKFGIGTSNPKKRFHISAPSDDGIALSSGNAILGETGSGTFTQLLFWNGTNSYYGRSATGAGINNHYFRTGGIDRMIINSNGNVGIGTTNPTEKLQVNGNISAFEGDIILHNNSINQEDSGTIRWNEYPGGTNTNQSGAYMKYNGSNNYLQISTNDENNNYEHVRVYRGGRLVLQPNSGNVGIGTTNPSGKLEILKNADLSNAITLPNSGLIIRADNNGNDASLRFGVDNTNLKAVIQTQQTTTAAKFDLLINPFGGNIGIGTTTPDSKLAVNGNIHAKEVKIDLIGWPDYVFESDYNLPTLQEVENHIVEKGHLQNIPSAAEVAENGIQLGEMNKKLLEKIEELTLYMIEQNKKTAQLQKEVIALKKKNIELEKKIK
ncbi:hypothetical protein [Aquimarina sp. MMG016]|uniref:hypothetical protein n=1 Tax=Aquimarina sp. MMG016 TaxID=2822690 RepID=UPI001B3A58B9|nr:hypothetical protein [Aquimarina sp. MMG016]MBQ4820255.1 hypothetical protein [Aquimarina sp. MMG016]